MEASISIIVLSFFYQHDRKTKCYLQQDPVNRRLCSCIQIFYRRCCSLLNVEKAGKAEASDQREVKQLWPTCIIVIEKSKKCITESECAQGSDFFKFVFTNSSITDKMFLTWWKLCLSDLPSFHYTGKNLTNAEHFVQVCTKPAAALSASKKFHHLECFYSFF